MVGYYFSLLFFSMGTSIYLPRTCKSIGLVVFPRFRSFLLVYHLIGVVDLISPTNLQVYWAGRFSSFPVVSPCYHLIGGRFSSFPLALRDRFLPLESLEGKCRINRFAGGSFSRLGPRLAPAPSQIGNCSNLNAEISLVHSTVYLGKSCKAARAVILRVLVQPVQWA
jgi:hypothetical protein